MVVVLYVYLLWVAAWFSVFLLLVLVWHCSFTLIVLLSSGIPLLVLVVVMGCVVCIWNCVFVAWLLWSRVFTTAPSGVWFVGCFATACVLVCLILADFGLLWLSYWLVCMANASGLFGFGLLVVLVVTLIVVCVLSCLCV